MILNKIKIDRVRRDIERYLKAKNRNEGILSVQNNRLSCTFDKNTLIIQIKGITEAKGGFEDFSTDLLVEIADMFHLKEIRK